MENIKKDKLRSIFMEFKDGNKSSYEVLYKEYFNMVYGAVFSIIKNKELSEDIVQEVFLKIYNLEKEKFPEKGELSWLYIISKNEALGYLRRKKQEVNIDEIYELGNDDNEIDELIDIQTYKKMIKGLNKQEQEIISLKVLSNFTFKSIGEMLSMPTATVQWKYYKAVSSLKISLANLVGAILTFILFVGRKVNIRKSKVNMNENIDNVNKELSNDKTEKAEESFTSSEDVKNPADRYEIPSAESSGFSSKSYSSIFNFTEYFENVDIVQPVLIGISGVFLIISVTFAIFFKNYQQKRKSKTSK